MQTEVISEGKIQEKRGISSAVLKNIAVVTMLIDHIGAVIVTRLLIRNGLYEAMANQEAYTAWMGQNGRMYGIYMAMRIIGRFAFPIYCFLLVEGFQKTHNVKKYLGRMFLFALISEVPFDLAKCIFYIVIGAAGDRGTSFGGTAFCGYNGWKNDSARGTECRYYSDRMCTGIGS